MRILTFTLVFAWGCAAGPAPAPAPASTSTSVETVFDIINGWVYQRGLTHSVIMAGHCASGLGSGFVPGCDPVFDPDDGRPLPDVPLGWGIVGEPILLGTYESHGAFGDTPIDLSGKRYLATLLDGRLIEVYVRDVATTPATARFPDGRTMQIYKRIPEVNLLVRDPQCAPDFC